MNEATLEDLYRAVDNAIKRGDDVCYDVASNECQILGNVKRMHWFREAVAQEFISSTRKYRHLKLTNLTEESNDAKQRHTCQMHGQAMAGEKARRVG